MDILAYLTGLSVDEIKWFGWVILGLVLVTTFVLGFITERFLIYRKSRRKTDDDG